MDKIPVGIIGAGWAGTTHAEALRYSPEAKLVAITDPKFGQPKNGQISMIDLESRYGVELMADVEALIEGKDVDAIFIASPTSTIWRRPFIVLRRESMYL